MPITIKNWNLQKLILLCIDILLLICNTILFFCLFYISYIEYYYRGSLKLYFPQFFLMILVILLDVIMNSKNISHNYSGHNKYGMIMRFFIFYLLVPCIVLTHQRSVSINHDEIKSTSKFILYFGSIVDGIVIISMIVSFIVIDEQKEKKVLVKKNKKNDFCVTPTEKINMVEDDDDQKGNIFSGVNIEMKY